MNDPGLDDPIANAGQQVDGHYQPSDDSDMDEEEEEKNFMLPSRWWFASTAFPLIAGTFGPMANAFSICALVQNWRVSIPPGGTEEHGITIKDPAWLIAINAVSLVFALTANLFLLLNMARRVRFAIAQPITIFGFYFASFLLIGLISVVGGGHLHAHGVEDQALTQAYYYAIFAAGLYFIIAGLMMVTVWGAFSGRYGKDFKLTVSQRTLMLQTISYLTYLLLGALIYCKIENWEFLDAVYFVNFTLLTVGIGDYSPATHAGRAFLFPYAIGGIVILGLVIGSIRSLVLDRGKKKLSARNMEKTRKAVLKRLTQPTKHPWHPGYMIQKRVSSSNPDFSLKPEKDGVSELKRRETEFHIMREIQNLSSVQRKWISLVISGTSWFFLWFVGAAIFWRAEKNQSWTYFQALYFAYTSLLTIGYGDFSPMSNSGKPFFVFWSLLAVPTLTILISNMGDTVVKGIKDVTLILGELTVLPGEKGSYRDRIKVGVSKITGGRYNVGPEAQKLGKTIDEKESEMDKEDMGVEERPPGLPNPPKQPGEGDNQKSSGNKRRKDSNRQNSGSISHQGTSSGVSLTSRLAADMEAEENLAQAEARTQHNPVVESAHHYRLLLIQEIAKVYSHIGQQPPRKYTFKEWQHFLRLLGEDESSPKFHRAPPISAPKSKQYKRQKAELESAVPIDDESNPSVKNNNVKQQFGEDGTENASAGAADTIPTSTKADSKQKSSFHNWSWMGNRSPLMGDKEEAQWLLERLMRKLEAELRKEVEERKKKGEDVGEAGAELDAANASAEAEGEAEAEAGDPANGPVDDATDKKRE